ncbi:MAG TPA: hypothetical protein V6C76_12520 [Drouetiella sp.]
MFRNESSNSTVSKAAVGEQEILAMLEALLKVESPLKPLHKKVVEYIIHCSNVELLTGLASHVCAEVRCAVASNRFLPDELVWKLAEDANFAVRARLADNKYIGVFLLETLAEDEDDRIASRALRTLEKLRTESLTTKVVHWVFASFPSRQIS